MHYHDSAAWHITEPGIMDTDRYLSSANAPDFEEDVRLCIESGARHMVLNCAPLTYITSAGLRSFLTIASMMEKVGGEVSVQGLSGQPLEMFHAVGMDSIVPFADETSFSRTEPSWA